MHAAASESAFVMAKRPFLYFTKLTGTARAPSTLSEIILTMLPLLAFVSPFETSKYLRPFSVTLPISTLPVINPPDAENAPMLLGVKGSMPPVPCVLAWAAALPATPIST
jgi:hypothetical protein